ncbi:hypothetical protein GF359_04225 [candidate division WOR-3 bacterium]|uniref:HNH nuclease domain-containing protein n=1 Tax=candidate division WOR-3 bacterium TaxID=2052148 RepID=A0A9D5KA64_UNCW3|nr:hypothetical protein [candidate division WOR-3 bacterium]MBD3364405.1 hypothetical protein [candidate division WOR-3 bacterium]
MDKLDAKYEVTGHDGFPKLSAGAARDIRKRVYNGETQTSLADEYGVAVKTVNHCVLGNTHKDAGGPIRKPNMGRLSPSRIKKVIKLWVNDGFTVSAIASQVGIAGATVLRIVTGRRTRNLPSGYDPDEAYRKRIYNKLVARCREDPVTGCWEWQGSINPYGYGMFTVKRRRTSVHRWMAHFSDAPHLKDFDISTMRARVLRRCGNRTCINPDHLVIKPVAEYRETLWEIESNKP